MKYLVMFLTCLCLTGCGLFKTKTEYVVVHKTKVLIPEIDSSLYKTTPLMSVMDEEAFKELSLAFRLVYFHDMAISAMTSYDNCRRNLTAIEAIVADLAIRKVALEAETEPQNEKK